MILIAGALLALSSTSLSASTISSNQAGNSPNILILLLDDVGVDALSAYGLGSDLPTTPNIDALALDGIRFDNVWSNPVCSPTRATIQTGRYGFRTTIGYTVTELTNELPTGEVTLPEMMAISGLDYATAAFGKWHLGNSKNGGPSAPNVAGYDYYAGGLINLHPPQTYFSWNKTINGQTMPDTRYITSDTVTEASSWIKKQQGPWFAYVAFHTPHTPYHAPPPNLHTVDLTDAGSPIDNPRPFWKAMLESADFEIGRLFNLIDIDFNETLVILLADNGTNPAVIVPPFLPAHGKGTAYQGGVNVPMIVKGPGVAKNAVCTGLINTTDVFASVAEITGAKYPGLHPNYRPKAATSFSTSTAAAPQTIVGNTLDSVSFAPYFINPDRPSIRQYLWTELYRPSTDMPPTTIRQAVRDTRFKLLMRTTPVGGNQMFLFDLSEDPHELVDLLSFTPLTSEQQLAFDTLMTVADDLLNSK